MRFAVPLAAVNAAVLTCGVLAAGSVGARDQEALATAGRDRPPAESPSGSGAVAPTVPTATAPAAPATATTPTTATATTPTTATATTPAPTTAPPAVQAPSGTATVQPPAPPERVVTRTGWGPYATVGPVTLHFPGEVVEVVGLHQAGHDGAQPQQPVEGAGRIGRMSSRARGTHTQGAADIVVDPTREVRSPVTGTVLRAGTYTLYCDHVDDYLVVEPDARPGWQVKLLHFEGLTVSAGDRVQAGVTVVGARARVLPFSSQIDKHTVSPHWPHVHVEVVDPAVPDRSSGGGCD